MGRSVVLLSFVFCVLLADGVRGATITIKNCTDRALCFSGCQTFQLPAGSCLVTNTGSQIINCIPTVSVCGDLTYYSDAACSNVILTDGFVCDRCNKDHSGTFNTVSCLRENGVESLALSTCTSQCGTCDNYMNVTAGQCLPAGSGGDEGRWKRMLARNPVLEEQVAAGASFYVKYTGSVTCTAIQLLQWTNGNQQCQSFPSQQPELPEDSCIGGLSVHCNF